MNLEQQKRIKNYLFRIGLSFDLQLEFYDHISSQIEELMAEGNDFETSFSIVKINWKSELRLVKMNFFSTVTMPRIQKKMVGKSLTQIYKKAIAAALFVFALFVIFVKLVSLDYFLSLFSYYYYLLFAGMVIYSIINYPLYKMARKYRKPSIASGQIHIPIMITGFLFTLIQIFDAEIQGTRFYTLVQNMFTENAKYKHLVGFLGYNILAYAGIFAVYNFTQEYNKIKPFLKIS
ncbi:MAG: hypothetical protein Q4G16_03665 [Cruoricaptor ignavus]|nr:hypothetical protein [Cruoricaptor ignavus]